MVKKSPLHSVHEKLGASFTEFCGFEMPLQFSSLKEEHLCVRRRVGVFDVSHMSNLWVTGKDAAHLISLVTIEDAGKIGIGRSQYTALCRENGTVIDDTIFMHLGKDRFMMIPNAGMNEIAYEWLKKKASEYDLSDVVVEDVSSEFVILAVQGPDARSTLQKLTETDLSEIKFFGCQEIVVAGVPCYISYTGYTGEKGFELQIKKEEGKKVFSEILKAGEEFSILPIGLGARDTLRLEKSFILAGNEFEGGRTPLEATMGWAINWDHEFIGKEALVREKEKGGYQRLTNMVCKGKGIPRHGCTIFKDGQEVGVVTSGTMSPCLGVGIAMGYVHPDHRKAGDILEVEVRGKKIEVEVVKPPIVPKDWAENNPLQQ